MDPGRKAALPSDFEAGVPAWEEKEEGAVLTFGLTVALIGMGVVFIALVFLVGVIKVLGYASALTDRAGASKAAPVPGVAARKAVTAATGSPPQAAPAATAASSRQEEAEGEVLAVVAAAVAAYHWKP